MPPNPPSKADMQISKSENKISCPLPLPNPGDAPGKSIYI